MYNNICSLTLRKKSKQGTTGEHVPPTKKVMHNPEGFRVLLLQVAIYNAKECYYIQSQRALKILSLR